MTYPNTRYLNAELEHLVRVAKTSPAFLEFAQDKARRLASQHPWLYGDLPMLLSNALSSKPSGPPPASTAQT